MIEIIPAIDIIGGRCVRLTKGDYAKTKVYDASPVDMAKAYADCGVKRIHLVDLDGAKVSAMLPLTKFACVLGSFSKTLSLAGERIGYFLSNPAMPDQESLVAAVTLTNRTLGFVNAPVIGQRLAAALINETVDLDVYDRRRKLMAKVLSDAGIEFEMPKGAFYFFAKSPVEDDSVFVDALLKERILVVPGKGFGFGGYVRLSCSVDEKIIARSAEGFKRAMEKFRG